MNLRRILYAGPEGRTGWIGPQIDELEITFVLLTKGDSGCAPADRIDIELDRSIAECEALKYRIAAVQSHQSARKPLLAEKFCIFFGLPVFGCHGDRYRFRAPGNRKR